MEPRSVYVAGAWRQGRGAIREVLNPATEEVLAEFRDADADDAGDAVAAAVAAWPAWRDTAVAERAALVRAIADGIEARREEFLRVLIDDVGTPRRFAEAGQLDSGIAVFRAAADAIEAHPASEQVGTSLVTWEPLGVAALIAPWNYPLYQSALKVAPALAAGCTVVLKPSEIAPLSIALLTEVIDGLGLPAGVFNLVIGPGETVGETLVSHPDVAVVSFTGSGRAGRRVAALAGAQLTPVSLELGGKGASIVLPGADVRAAVAHAVGQCFGNAGQTCAAMTRIVVVDALADEVEQVVRELVTAITVGDPTSSETGLGPVVSQQQRDRVLGYIEQGLESGARALVGPGETRLPSRGYFVPPVVFADVTPDMAVAQEEIFGPVLSIIRVADEAEAIDVAESTRYGLTGAVWAGADDDAMRVARRLTTGSVTVNGGRIDWTAPFGGRKDSGFGRERGRYGLDEFLTTKAFHVG